ncbi:von Willebrand factor A domain-containing protein 5A isoform X2 [Hyalella azteca]|uniref:von Willebrand factor A domain-containing protein 5A isoform X2 n=1 Tax=Hyalella azteca TaxID=294128 RepID=A0A8B7PCH4_HYAAZ|nr:von Willebrand factor A domain-containing protein 5A isoform X2 [Hyalella azteca]
MRSDWCIYGLIGYVEYGYYDSFNVPLESVSSSVSVHGYVAHVKSTLRYRNPRNQPLQVYFRTPKDESSALYHVEAKIQDRNIVAKCLEVKKAAKIYEDALRAGKTALLVREEPKVTDIFNLALGNLPPESSCEVTLSLVCELRVATDGGVEFRLPTVLNPRYQPASCAGPVAPVGLDLSAVAVAQTPYTMDVRATVSGALDIACILSHHRHSDAISVTIHDDYKKASIKQDGGYTSDHEWGFVVHYNNPYQPQAIIETGDVTATGLMMDQVLMINMFPQLPEASYSRFNEIIFVVDRSGSMHGHNMQSARAVLLLFLKSLPPGCRFNIVSFGSTHSFLFKEGSRTYSEATLAMACELHASMKANMGGTEVLAPLKAIYSQPVDPSFSRHVLLLTDGDVWNTDEVTELAARHASSTRVFTVGIGEGASTALVKGLARAGRGRAELVTATDRMQTKVMGLVASMLQASVRGVTVSCEFDAPSRLSLVPSEPPVIFGGQHLVTYARMPPGAQLKSITLKGTVDGDEWQCSVTERQMVTVHDERLTLHRLAARASILDLCLKNKADARKTVVELSCASGVLSRHTAFVAVDQQVGETDEQRAAHPKEAQPCGGMHGEGYMKARLVACVPVRFPMVGGGPPRSSSPSRFESQRAIEMEMCEKVLVDDATNEVDKFCPSGTPKENIYCQIIAQQKFDGSWLADDIASILQTAAGDLLQGDAQPANLMTALVVVLLQEYFSDRAAEWGLLVIKAKNFLKQSPAVDINELLKAAKHRLDALRSKYPHHVAFV